VKKIISSKDDHQRYKSIAMKKDAKDLADEEILKAVVAIHGRVRDR
jgi:demethoxyubiquinone hydroxylase (CLK1/Coq7/Cat5 family)